MALLLLATAGAVSCRNQARDNTGPAGGTPPADQIMIGVTTTLVTGGARRGLVSADSAFVSHDSRHIRFTGLRATLFDTAGHDVSRLTALRATLNVDTGILDASGSVQVSTPAGDTLTAARLTYDQRLMLLHTDSAFTRVAKAVVSRGVGYTSDPGLRRQQP
ncbi:MAG TPA: LPS export ABC transporter periplasmic protein LptC [Gemmatimonadales bacterium]|nr:LPS export ABC transporter periplasmic protein LptC [Gemmatimonadales bacterium]